LVSEAKPEGAARFSFNRNRARPTGGTEITT
jgi:hypothetical protein